MQGKQVGTIPWEYKRIRSHLPCESCGLKMAKVKLSLPIGEGPMHRLCESCAPVRPS